MNVHTDNGKCEMPVRPSACLARGPSEARLTDRAGPGARRGAEHGAPISARGAGHGARVRDPSRPGQP